MKLSHIELKPDAIRLDQLNDDRPRNGEVFAEYMNALQLMAKGQCPIPPWLTREECIEHTKQQIRKLLV